MRFNDDRKERCGVLFYRRLAAPMVCAFEEIKVTIARSRFEFLLPHATNDSPLDPNGFAVLTFISAKCYNLVTMLRGAVWPSKRPPSLVIVSISSGSGRALGGHTGASHGRLKKSDSIFDIRSVVRESGSRF